MQLDFWIVFVLEALDDDQIETRRIDHSEGVVQQRIGMGLGEILDHGHAVARDHDTAVGA